MKRRAGPVDVILGADDIIDSSVSQAAERALQVEAYE